MLSRLLSFACTLVAAVSLSTSAFSQSSGFPVEAGSWGGKVRSGPGTNYGRVAGLREGERVTLLQNTGVMMNGYPWFQIRFRGGQTGYKWGGILCARNVAVSGLYKSCNGFQAQSGTPAPNAGAFPVEAGSWGGKVRSGPGTNYGRQDGLSEGEPITILENTGVMMNGYPWFKISYRGGRTGYKWGGILCARTTPVTGVYKQCPGYETQTAQPQPPQQPQQPQQPAAPQAQDSSVLVRYRCDDGSELISLFEVTGNSSAATFSHDGYPEVRLDEVVSGSGAKYSDGTYTLHTKANTAILNWENNQVSCTEK